MHACFALVQWLVMTSLILVCILLLLSGNASCFRYVYGVWASSMCSKVSSEVLGMAEDIENVTVSLSG